MDAVGEIWVVGEGCEICVLEREARWIWLCAETVGAIEEGEVVTDCNDLVKAGACGNEEKPGRDCVARE